MNIKRLSLSLAYILLNLLIYPPFNLGGLAFFAYLPFLFLLGSGISVRFYFGLSLIYNLLYFFWLIRTNVSGWVLLSLFFALSSLPGFLLIRYCWRRNWLFILSLLLVGFEYLRVATDYMLPFQIIGYSQWNIYAVLQLAALGGVWLVSWFIYSSNLCLYNIWRFRKPNWIWLLILLILFCLANITVLVQRQPKHSLRVALIQTNLCLDGGSIDEELFWHTYTESCRQAALQNPDLYIWPEVALPYSLRENWDSAKRLRNLLNELKSGIILGNRDSDKFSLRYNDNYNAAFYINADGVVLGTHYKQKLIPFIETTNYHLPFLPYFIRNKIQAGIYRIGRNDRNLFEIHPDLKIAPMICYEAVNGDYVRKFTRQKPGFIVNVSSDGWSRSLTEHQLNFNFNVFRAVENRLYLVRVAEDGISAVISPRGDILAVLPAFTSGNIVFDVPY